MRQHLNSRFIATPLKERRFENGLFRISAKMVGFLVTFLMTSSWAMGQKTHTISGHLTSKMTGEALISASIYDENSGKGGLTNNFGFYSLTLKEGPVSLVARYAGYQTFKHAFNLKGDTTFHFSLAEFTVDEVEIIAENEQRIEEKTEMSTIDVPIKQIKLMPALLGEVDIIKAIQLLPGVQSGGEGSTGLYVRGGGPDQNLILLDDVPLYYISHLGGFFSVFNADAISSVKLTKGGFPARYGGRLSSVVDVRMKEGNMKEFHGEGSIGLISSKLSLEGPIIKDKTSFIVSGRRTYLDLLTRPISKAVTNGEANFGYYFSDLNAKINHKFSDKDRLYLSGYWGSDNLGITTEENNESPGHPEYYEFRVKNKTIWGNKMAALRWNHIWNPQLFSNLTATYTNYRFKSNNNIFDAYAVEDSGKVKTEQFEGDLDYGSGIRDFGVKLDFDFYPNPNHSIKFGINSTFHKFTPGLLGIKFKTGENTPATDTTLNAQITHSIENSIYIEDEFKIGRLFSANFGLHGVQYLVNEKAYYSLQPRLSARYLLAPKVALKASYVHMTQFIHLLSNSGAGLPIDLWVPATEKVRPQRSWQAAAGVATSFFNGKLEFSIEGYYKEMSDLIEYKEGTSFFLGVEDSDWQDRVETGGKGTAYGVEVLLQKKQGKTTGWVGYTLSWNNRQFENLNQGEVYPYKFDRRHDASIVVAHQLSDRISISGTWVFGTGNALTLPSGGYGTLVYPYGNEIVNSYGSFGELLNGNFGGTEVKLYENGRNGFRMQPYHRLDLGISFTKKKKWGERTWNISIYNVYNRLNPYTYVVRNKHNPQTGDFSSKELRKIALFPIIPSISYSFKF